MVSKVFSSPVFQDLFIPDLFLIPGPHSLENGVYLGLPFFFLFLVWFPEPSPHSEGGDEFRN